MLHTIDYYKGALQIPNLDKDTTAFENNYMAVYEKEILIKLLGYPLYKEMIDNYNTSVDDKWKHLVEGADFIVTIGGTDYTMHWNGLINTEKISLISYYVWYNYTQQNYQQLTGLGVGSQTPENATVIHPNEKLVWSWNESRKLAGLYDYPMIGQEMTYNSVELTLFNFLVHNTDDYTNWLYSPMLEMNVLGI